MIRGPFYSLQNNHIIFPLQKILKRRNGYEENILRKNILNICCSALQCVGLCACVCVHVYVCMCMFMCGVVCGVVWCGVVWCGVVWCGEWCGAWCGAWCGVVYGVVRFVCV